MNPGQLLQEGVVVSHGKDGVMVGREAEPQERDVPPRHTEHYVAGRRVFLSADQAPILPAGLHVKGTKKSAPKKSAKKGKGK